MKQGLYLVFVAFAVAISVLAIRKLHAQSSPPQSMEMGATETQTNEPESAPVLVTEIPSGYRDRKLVSVAHEAGKLNDIRAILGNDLTINAYREGNLPFPEGAIIGRIACLYVPSDENNRIFGRQQSFVPGAAPAWYLQFMVKDSKKYAATGGWGYGQFDKNGMPAPAAMMTSCYPCHQRVQARDYIFTRYTP